jgi:radical SAM protein (TIGR04043 family)
MCHRSHCMDERTIQVELQSLGVRVQDNAKGRRGGAGPAEGQVIVFNDRSLSVPTQSRYVASSPYEIRSNGSSLVLLKDDVKIKKVFISPKPRYYGLKNHNGIPFEKIALIHGRDCLATTVYQDCLYWNSDACCTFCGIGFSLKNNTTVLEKAPEELAMVAVQAKLLDKVSHVTLTTGMRICEKETISHLSRCVKAMKQKSDLPVHVQICPPSDINCIDNLKNAGADTIGIHIESFDKNVLRRVAPSKAGQDLEFFTKAWSHAVSVFGKNQVSSFIIAGLGEDPASIRTGAELLCEIGVFPYLLPFRPIPDTPLETSKPPAPETMLHLYEEVSVLLKKYGLSSGASKAGCVRCGACSSISLFE